MGDLDPKEAREAFLMTVTFLWRFKSRTASTSPTGAVSFQEAAVKTLKRLARPDSMDRSLRVTQDRSTSGQAPEST